MDAKRFDRFTKAFGTRLSRRTALSASVGLGGLAVAGTRAAAQEVTPVVAGEPTETLFVQTFERGTLRPNEGEAGTFVLTLHGEHGRTVTFSDRPERLVTSVPTQAFLDGLGFSPRNPPNAALVIEPSRGETDVLVLELRNPRYDAADQILTYDVTPLEDVTAQLGLSFQEAPRLPDPPGETFGAAQLFIDGCQDLTDCDYSGGAPLGGIPDGPISQCFANGSCQPQNCPGGLQYAFYIDLCNATYSGCNDDCYPE